MPEGDTKIEILYLTIQMQVTIRETTPCIDNIERYNPSCNT